MKKISSLFIVMIAVVASTFAQKPVKFGYLNSSELISLMPESSKADTAISKYASELDVLAQQMYTEYQKKAMEAQQKSKTMSEEQVEVLSKELADLEKRITDFQQSAQDKIDAKKDKLYAPILLKANEAIKAVAKANGYTYVFDSAAGSILFADEADNIIALVKTYLKLPDAKPAPVKPTPVKP
ncbi:MAG TPA: OmpH family outer membrane protein [Chitinophagales bacterium]|nr:OmpH family outer membrane protein [Chitinophagales bacterium]